MEKAEKVNWHDEGLESDNQGYIYGIYYYQDEEVIEVEWFKTEEKRDTSLNQYE